MSEPTTIEVPQGELYLGKNKQGEPTLLEAADLTTHGVIVGMTGSGKTGLGMVMLEEALLSDIPTLIIDPKGDMGNLALTFPNMSPMDFAPWVGAEEATKTAQMWGSGLARSGIGPARITKLADTTDMRIYTPGSSAGIGLNLIGSMAPPNAQHYSDPAALFEIMHDEIEGLASTLLRLVGIDSDPMSGREHILISNIINHYWQNSSALNIEMLIEAIITPPMRKLGVLSLDTLFPQKDRMELAVAMNGLAASPAFAAWTQGQALDIDQMLFSPDNRTQAAIINIHHLNDDERQLVITTVLNKVVTWMRRQQGSDELKLLIYIDEVFGFVPPTSMPPSKKPILTLMKQARAFGVGLVLATQNPVDIDYKAISNAGTWMIGRLQTERDKGRLLDGMSRSDGSVDIAELDSAISSLDKREFILHSTRRAPQRFATRWAISYLAGPLSRDQINLIQPPTALPPGVAAGAAAGAFGAAVGGAAVGTSTHATPLADNETTIAPKIARGVNVAYLHPSAPWASQFGADFSSKRLKAAIAVRFNLVHDDTKANLRHHSEWESICWIDSARLDIDACSEIDYDERDFTDTAPDGVRYVLPDIEISKTPYFTEAKRIWSQHLYRNSTVELLANKELKLYSRLDENRDAFARRCQEAADEHCDEDIAKLREALLKKETRARTDLARLEDRIREIQSQVDAANTDSLAGAFDLLGGLLSGRRRSTRSVRSSRRRSSAARERLQTAENRYADRIHDLEALRLEVQDDIEEIEAQWQDVAQDIEIFSVGLRKSDITIDELTLIWIPA